MFWRVNDFTIAPQNQIITLAIDSDIMEIISVQKGNCQVKFWIHQMQIKRGPAFKTETKVEKKMHPKIQCQIFERFKRHLPR